MTKDEFRAWAIERGFSPEGATSGQGSWSKGKGDSLGKGDSRYILRSSGYIRERRPLGRFSRWQRVSSHKYAEVERGPDGRLHRAAR